jgi:membrane protease YdiL (CAAX protease family)
MSTDSSNPAKAPKETSLKVATIIQTVVIGLLLYIIPPMIASFFLIAGISLSDMSVGQAENWLKNAAVAQFVYVLMTEIIVVGLLLWLLKFFKETWHSIGVIRPKVESVSYVIGGILVYYATYLVVATVVYTILPLNFEQRQEIGFSTDATGANMAFAFAALVVLPPIVEEILFRGFLYTRFKRVVSIKWAAVAVSLLFAAAHLQFGSGNELLWVAALDTFILSLVLVYLREKTGNIWAGVGVHALKNLVAFLILFNVVQW